MSLLNLRRFKKKTVVPEKKPAVSTAPLAPRKLAVSSASPAQKGPAKESASPFLSHPRVSEKASFLKAGNCYVFEVPLRANKRLVAEAIKKTYHKTPTQVRMLPIPAKTLFARGRRGVSGGGKKAYVFLKKGDTIEL